MNQKQATNQNERRGEEKTPPKKAWRKPTLAELDLEATETGVGTTTDTMKASSS